MKLEDKANALTFSTASEWFGIDRTQFIKELRKITQHLPRTETGHGPLVNLTYLFLAKPEKQALVHIQHEQAARRILEETPPDANELQWFSAIVSSFLTKAGNEILSPLFEFLKRNKESGENYFKNKIETYVQQRAMQRYPDDAKADYAISDAMRYVSKMAIVSREELEKINYYLNHYHPKLVSLITRITCKIKLRETSTQIVKRKIVALRQMISQFNEAKVKYDLEPRILLLKRLKETELNVFIYLFNLLHYIGTQDPLHEVLDPIQQKMEQNFQKLSDDFRELNKKNVSKSGEIVRRNFLEKQQTELVETYHQLKANNNELIQQKNVLEKEVDKYRKQTVDQESIEILKNKITELETENSQLMDDYYSFKVKFLNIVPSDSDEEKALEIAWKEYLVQKENNTDDFSLGEKSSSDDGDDLKFKEVDEDLLDEPTRINMAEISAAALKTLNNRFEIKNQKLDEINYDIKQQNKLMENRISYLQGLKQNYYRSKDFDIELEKQSLEVHCNILVKDKQKNMERLEEIYWKLKRLSEVWEGEKTEIEELLHEMVTKYSKD